MFFSQYCSLDVGVYDEYHWTPLHLSADSGDHFTISSLLSLAQSSSEKYSNLYVDSGESESNHPTSSSSTSSSSSFLGGLTAKERNFQMTPLHMALRNGYFTAAKVLESALESNKLDSSLLVDKFSRTPEAVNISRASWWPTSTSTRETSKLCDFDVREADSLTVEQFEKDFLTLRKPLLIKNAGSKWPAVKKWTRSYMEGIYIYIYLCIC